MTHYQTLGVDPSAPAEVIESAWKTLVRLYHPDNGPKADAKRCAEVNAAHDVLKDLAKRKAYDLQIRAHGAKNGKRKRPAQTEPSNPFGEAYPPAYQGIPGAVEDAIKDLMRSMFENAINGMFK